MDKKNKNSFHELEKEQIKDFGGPRSGVKSNIDHNISLFNAMAETLELYTGKLIKSILKIHF